MVQLFSITKAQVYLVPFTATWSTQKDRDFCGFGEGF